MVIIHITEWLRLEGSLKPTQPHLVPCAELPPPSSGCPGPQPACP